MSVDKQQSETAFFLRFQSGNNKAFEKKALNLFATKFRINTYQ